MQRRFILIVILAAIAFTGLIQAQEVMGPRIVAKEIKYDFGKVIQGTQAIHVFEVRNGGTEQLIIDRVASS